MARDSNPVSTALALWLNVELSLPIFRLALAVFIPWRGAAGFRPTRGMAPALMGCWIEGGAGFFLFSVLLGRRATGSIAAGTWRRRPSPGWLNVELSLPIFRLALAVFIPWRGAAGFDRRGMAPALMGCWIEGGAGFFLFSVLLGRRATGSIAAGTWRRRPSPGWLNVGSLSRFSGWRSRSLSLGEGLPDSTGAGWHPR